MNIDNKIKGSLASKKKSLSMTLFEKLSKIIGSISHPALVSLAMRFALAIPFWKSGILKWDGLFQLSGTTVYLFSNDFMLHLPGGPFPFPFPPVTAFLSGVGEVLFPALLFLGLGTRFAATALLLMSIVIQLTIPAGWPLHLTWAAMALGIMAWGPGVVSLDHLISRTLRSRSISLP